MRSTASGAIPQAWTDFTFVNDVVDERYNMKKSTRSALGHLKKLNSQFNDWFLAMAAYNAGPGRVRAAMKRAGTTDGPKLRH